MMIKKEGLPFTTEGQREEILQKKALRNLNNLMFPAVKISYYTF
jgi:hypothetical protein